MRRTLLQVIALYQKDYGIAHLKIQILWERAAMRREATAKPLSLSTLMTMKSIINFLSWHKYFPPVNFLFHGLSRAIKPMGAVRLPGGKMSGW
jgi:hypothetical protein